MAPPPCRGRAPRGSPARARCRRWQISGPSLLLSDAAVAFDGAAPADHHVAVLFPGHAGHAAGHLLKALAVGGADLREEVDGTPEFDAAIEVACERCLLLLISHRPFVEISAFVRLEALAVLRF